MTPAEVQALLERAQESIDAANALVARGFFHFGASRAYYAMFYCAQALLLSRGKSFSRHSAVIAAFGREFAKPRLLDPKFHLYIRKALDVRQIADYDATRTTSKQTAEQTIARAKEFLEGAQAYLARETAP
ncbi:MAG: HEPN domain-containing protein [bacterium]|jgi:uncharacterized protein (UPF0332 family)|nr:HEPN domain-containing protein [bacterium]